MLPPQSGTPIPSLISSSFCEFLLVEVQVQMPLGQINLPFRWASVGSCHSMITLCPKTVPIPAFSLERDLLVCGPVCDSFLRYKKVRFEIQILRKSMVKGGAGPSCNRPGLSSAPSSEDWPLLQATFYTFTQQLVK